MRYLRGLRDAREQALLTQEALSDAQRSDGLHDLPARERVAGGATRHDRHAWPAVLGVAAEDSDRLGAAGAADRSARQGKSRRVNEPR